MKWSARIARTAVVLVSGIAMGSLLVGVAQSVTSTDFTYATKQTGYTSSPLRTCSRSPT